MMLYTGTGTGIGSNGSGGLDRTGNDRPTPWRR